MLPLLAPNDSLIGLDRGDERKLWAPSIFAGCVREHEPLAVFGAHLPRLSATLSYPVGSVANKTLGNGTVYNVDFPAHTTTTILFPFQVKYVLLRLTSG